MFDSDLRLMPMLSLEDEWRYLVNETFIGEKCIVPLLNQVLDADFVSNSVLKFELERQVAEEINHVRIYYKHVGTDKLKGSQYDKDLFAVISGIKSITLKLFALQGMLEGIALGALDYRLRHWQKSPSYEGDQQVKYDEIGHTKLSYPFFQDLIKNEGVIDEVQFKETAKSVNQVFLNCFSGNTLQGVVKEMDKESDWTTSDFESTPAIREFRKQSSKVIAENRRAFLGQYFEVAKNV